MREPELRRAFRIAGAGASDSPCAQRRGVGVPNPGPRARQQAACERRRLCSWKETRRPAASASKPDTTSASARGYTNTPAEGGGRWRRTPPGSPPAPPAPHPGLTVHRVRLRVAVGEPGPHAEAGAVGAGPDPGVRERQRRPAGGAVQAGHGAGRPALREPARGAGRKVTGRPPRAEASARVSLQRPDGACRGARPSGGSCGRQVAGEIRGRRAWRRGGHPHALPGQPGRGGLMINARSGAQQSSRGSPGGGGGHSCSTARSQPRCHPRTCRPPGAPRGRQLSEAARVEMEDAPGGRRFKGSEFHPPEASGPARDGGGRVEGAPKGPRSFSPWCLIRPGCWLEWRG